MNSSTLTKLITSGLLFILSGCSILIPQADPTRYYVLKARSQGSLTSGQKIAVGVGPATIPGYLNRDEIVTEGPASGLDLADYHVWGESLEKAVTRVVAKNMSRLLNSPAVVPFPDADTKFDYRATIVIRRFEMGADHKVHLDVSYIIDPAAGLAIPGSSRSRDIVVAVPQPDSYDSVVDTMSQALASLSNSIARDVLTLNRKR